ncbi:hypothetical protein F441_05924, partial [Phytophthora nicotianae CJ01A1]
THLRRLSDDEQSTRLSELVVPDDAEAVIDESHTWWQDDADEALATEDGENRRGTGCYPGSRLWPSCRGWGSRGDCFPGSRLWPSCRAWGGRGD